jgi:hypothetical protein
MPPILSYLLSVAAAAVVLFAAFEWPVPLRASLAPFYVFEIVVALTSIFVVTIGPFLVVRRIRSQWPVLDLALYPALGLGLGLFGALLLAVTVKATGLKGDPDTLSIHEGLNRFVPHFALAGLAGGLAYWGASRRRRTPPSSIAELDGGIPVARPLTARRRRAPANGERS